MRTSRGVPTLVLAALLTSTAWAQSDNTQYSFEQGKQGWTIGGDSIARAESTTARPFSGTRSLAVVFNASGARTNQQVMVANPAAGPGTEVTFRVFLPVGAAIRSLQVFVQETSANGWRWTANWLPIAAMSLGAWNTLAVTVPADAGPLQGLGVNFETSGAYSGTVYVDSVGWAGSAPPPPPPPPPSGPPPSPSSSSSGYSFETGIQGWSSSANGVIGVSTSTARAYEGTRSLEVQLDAPASQSQQVSVGSPAVQGGKTVNFRLFIPTGAPLKSVQIFAQESAASSWRWTALWRPASALTLGAWNTLALTIPSDATAVQSLGVEFEVSSPWVGSVFVDAVSWDASSGGVSTTPPPPPPPPARAPPPPTSGSSCLRVMPLGDSITEGVNGGYRNDLYTQLKGLGCGLDFVGSVFDPYAVAPDKNHEGHPGFTTYDIRQNVGGWLAAYTPDYVLLMIGTNDIAWWTVKNGAEIAADQAMVIDAIQQAQPNAWIIVASIPPISSRQIPPNNVDRAQLGRDYNAAAKTRIDARIAAGQKVRYADVYSVLSLADLYDGVHPTQAAHGKIAPVWRQALQGIVTCTSPSSSCGP